MFSLRHGREFLKRKKETKCNTEPGSCLSYNMKMRVRIILAVNHITDVVISIVVNAVNITSAVILNAADTFDTNNLEGT